MTNYQDSADALSRSAHGWVATQTSAEYRVTLRDRQTFVRTVLHLLTCHEHHFVIHVDTWTIIGSDMAMHCIEEIANP